ncbi:putative hydrolase YxeP [Aliiroseovarius sp. xm-m-379]|uniref:amidohydrolase n=2 Tax=Aliiroseovarius TaxID=1658781 RepID=UPI001569673A|nr:MULTISPECIES: amidohydrolase [unclassified Aliiroseovarius]NRP62943.1 putative hydrolase YxeP [Aliiroseovarius sp. xm-a-151]NRP11684.1 putative hydrolase YxeP [Aliiroseovarius sp. xm-d-517]NRP25703.1 putative hydrolase YxeP [Aliiroseovarius sp. xm-m-379]NRP31209.1 putative hydrolase YxeP [Aliiroseovarius sp. xm-m-314]NRP34502.1 putative hydrolase YxeP [Aliiroseovarius sp. xm-a-104]
MYQMPDEDLVELTRWRREMHRWPELSGQERETARRVVEVLTPLGPDHIETGLGGHGVAAVFRGAGKIRHRVMLRCELDGLPIEERSDAPHRSQFPGRGHLCGHDGHMAILIGVARTLARRRFEGLDVILLFQPAEETGAGAKAVLADGRLQRLAPDFALSLHNVPGRVLGEIGLKAGPVNCASRGMRVAFNGCTAHASQPETGRSPGLAMAEVISGFAAMAVGAPSDPDFRMATVTHASLGEKTFGIAPGAGEVWVTLRTLTNEAMGALVGDAEALVSDVAKAQGLSVNWSYQDVFAGCENDPALTGQVKGAVESAGFVVSDGGLPMRWSEDFGVYSEIAQTVMLFVGSGVDTPALHNPDYDFPDALIRIGTEAFLASLNALGPTPPGPTTSGEGEG